MDAGGVRRRTSLSGHNKQGRGRSDVWFTPPEIIGAVGPFDLDPCTLPPERRPWDTARFHYSEIDDGLVQPWRLAECTHCGLFNPGMALSAGQLIPCVLCNQLVAKVVSTKVWMNPPFGAEAGKWLKRLGDHGHGIALYHARTETEVFHSQVWDRASGILFLKGRINFHRPDGVKSRTNSGCPVCLISYGSACARDLQLSTLKGHYVSL